ncbi:MAG TPA: FAD-dependent 5-carboxymethylaminomethyl-2-thiouridine(34) oxidoreductase MnmC, partial [Castellaniella sp.]|nr:FAD-dependent 5-carboxymethylaminomethyl-2-thiouridine(34) oxidoreductase MnmC [Castellaniella sp.]
VAELRPGLGTPAAKESALRVAVVGGGLAGAGVARSLALRGHAVQVYDPVFAAGQVSDLRGAAALVPALTIDDDTRSRLSRSGLALARLRWRALPDQARPEACGALVCAQDPQEALKQQAAVAALAFPQDWVRWLDVSQAQARAGVGLHEGGLWFQSAMLVRPAILIPALLAHPGIQRHGARIMQLSFAAESWHLRTDDGAVAQADAIVLANASGAAALLETCQALGPFPKLRTAEPLAGQVSLFRVPPDAPGADVPRCILAGKGYCLPPRMGWGIAGSTYRSGVATSEADAQGHRLIQAQLAGWLPEASVPWLGRGAPEGWAGWRLATRDHLPIMGAVPGQPNLWLACAYGSRGLSWSALAGEVIAAQWAQEPVPLERELLARIGPR